MKSDIHQYVERPTNRVATESLYFDRTIRALYSTIRENAPFAYNLLLSERASAMMGFMKFDLPRVNKKEIPSRLFDRLHIRRDELLDPIDGFDSYRKIFERKIKYWKYRPLPDYPDAVVSPADSRMLPGSFCRQKSLFIKEKFFNFIELIGRDKPRWLHRFNRGDFAIFRLTPDKYHYNHAPVSGRVADIYEINGVFHSCNPGAIVKSVTPCSKNRRMVTVIDTDVENGSRVGLVAMIEIVAMMIGRIVQCYSDRKYHDPQPVEKGLFIRIGQPKSLFRPGSSTTVLIFEKNRIALSTDLIQNSKRTDVQSRFSEGFGTPLVETEVSVGAIIGKGL